MPALECADEIAGLPEQLVAAAIRARSFVWRKRVATVDASIESMAIIGKAPLTPFDCHAVADNPVFHDPHLPYLPGRSGFFTGADCGGHWRRAIRAVGFVLRWAGWRDAAQ